MRRAARILNKLPEELREKTVRTARESRLKESASLRTSITRVIVARFSKSGISLGLALAAGKSWDYADLGAHFCELRLAYMLATKYHAALPPGAVGDMINAALYYTARCHNDTTGEWMQCRSSMCAFTQAVCKQAVCNQKQFVSQSRVDADRFSMELSMCMLGLSSGLCACVTCFPVPFPAWPACP